MIIDLTKEEWEFLRRICIRTVAFAEMKDDNFIRVSGTDYQKAKDLMKKFIEGEK